MISSHGKGINGFVVRPTGDQIDEMVPSRSKIRSRTRTGSDKYRRADCQTNGAAEMLYNFGFGMPDV